MLLGVALSLALLGPAPPANSSGGGAPATRAGIDAWAGAGFEQTWVFALGVGLRWPDARTRFDVSLTAPWVVPIAGGGRLAAGASRLLVHGAWMGLAGRVELGLPWAVDSAGGWVSLDAGASVTPGVYRPRWSAGVELGLRAVLGTVWSPSEEVRALFGDRPARSTYFAPGVTALALTGLRLSAGAAARVTLVGRRDESGPRLDLFARAAFVAVPAALDTAGGPPTFPLPFDAMLGLACAL